MKAGLHSRYLRGLAWTALAAVLATALVNRAANPYCIFSTDWLKSSHKPETFTHLRLVKAYQVRHLRPRSLILGSSRAETGLDPSHPGWKERPVYNLGLSNASPYEIQLYLQHACEVGDVVEAVLLLDFVSFLEGGAPAPDFQEKRLASTGSPGNVWWHDLVTGLLTWDALKGAASTVTGRGGEKKYLPDGSRDAMEEDRRVMSKGGAAKAFAAYEKRMTLPEKSVDDAKFSLGTHEMECFRKILEIARAHGIRLHLAIAPSHARYLQIIHRRGMWKLYEDWKRELVSILLLEAGENAPFPLLDFGVFSEETEDPVPAQGLARYYYEASHFNKRLGNVLLNRLLSHQPGAAAVPPGGFGFLLASKALDRHLSAVRTARDDYERSSKP